MLPSRSEGHIDGGQMNTRSFDMKEMDTGRGLEFLTVGEAAQLIHVSESTVRNWINDGLLRCMRHGRVIRILKDDLLSFFFEVS